jgi:hypothetical protein
MKSMTLVRATLEFPRVARRDVLSAFLSLPGDLRPVRYSEAEDEPQIRIRDNLEFCEEKAREKGGFNLYAARAYYSVGSVGNYPITCHGYDIDSLLAQDFLMHMMRAHPIFGFACMAQEERHRNQLVMRFDAKTTIETWLGRNIEKNVPGLYWLTLLSQSLAKRHHVSLAALEKVALENIDLGGGLHLLRFYEHPEDWRTDSVVAKACASQPGIFDIERAKSEIDVGNKTVLEFSDYLEKWE